MQQQAQARMAIVRGDITKLSVDVIVNAANSTLLGGGGVDGAIHRAAGPELLAECKQLRGCAPGDAKITAGYRLPARFVIHTVGPIWSGGERGEEEVLASCYRNSLGLAVQHKLKTIAFPAISCGAYGYPIAEAAEIAVGVTAGFLRGNGSIERVDFVVASENILHAYQSALRDLSS
ncbi:MAG: O-acetyl-ADP-ribose deacetylase [Verrucomicrobiota bacterium]|nr:O-acetyl-ADP-ribose deacetylase [Verrucomicrobiota bacterium]